MNNGRDYELQCLLELLAVVINEEEIPEWQQAPQWNRLYKMADYHHVANVIYAPIIGINSKPLTKWKSSFEERYHYSVIMQERYKASEKTIMEALDKAQIHCMELEETVLNGCYERKENRYPMALGFLIEPGKTELLFEIMKKIDFEEKPIRSKKVVPGEYWFSAVGGITVVFYEKLPFSGKKLTRYFSLAPKHFPKKEDIITFMCRM